MIVTGLIADDQRDAWYAISDLYVSLSQHEGFGVPLVEAIAHGLPVLALANGAVPYTLGGDRRALLPDAAPQSVAAAMLALARDPASRAELTRHQQSFLERFKLDRQMPILLQALAQANAAPPVDADSRGLLADNLHFTVTGHINGSYSLAVVNRALAAALEGAYPGRIHVVPVEGLETTDISGVPEPERAALSPLVERKPPAGGPHVVISQHYPVFAPSVRGDATLAMFFWEESLVPAATIATLNATFRGILAPSQFVAKVLVDSGLSIPVRTIGYAPVLDELHEPLHQRPRQGRAFTFLHVSSCFPRKGVDLLLAAYAKSFRRDDNVRLVIKGFPNPHNDVVDQIAALRHQHPDVPEIDFIDAEISGEEMRQLYRDADAMVLPTRGEGFNIPAAEAMAAGLPLLVTAGGGHMDFCNADNATLIDFHFALAQTHLSTPNSVWMEPDAQQLAAAMRAVADQRAPDAQAIARLENARRAAVAVADRKAWAERIGHASLDILLAPPRRPVRVAWISTWGVRCGVAEYSRNLLDALPLGPEIAGVTVLCDRRTDPSEEDAAFKIRPAWTIGGRESMRDLATAIASVDPDILVLQHQPGLIEWGALAMLLELPALAHRCVVVTLHTTRHLLHAPAKERRDAVAALAGIARVLVHTVADLNLLKQLGLFANVTLLPHGTQPSGRPQAARPLTADSTPIIGCYGFFLQGKGIPQLIDAMTAIRAQFPNAQLRLVNADYGSPESAAEIGACLRAVERAGLVGVVEFHTGFLTNSDSLELLAECDVVVLPYQGSRESSSAALRTALGAGVPVAVTPLPLFDEAGDAVARLPGLDSAALAEGLIALLADAQRRMQVQVAAQHWLRDRDCRKVASRLQGMLLGLAVSPEPARDRTAVWTTPPVAG